MTRTDDTVAWQEDDVSIGCPTRPSPALAGMLRDARLERFDCSPALVERYVQAEFDRLDVDGSGYIELPEFTQYITRMTPWMRAEIMVRVRQSAPCFLGDGRRKAGSRLATIARALREVIAGRARAGKIQRERKLRLRDPTSD